MSSEELSLSSRPPSFGCLVALVSRIPLLIPNDERATPLLEGSELEEGSPSLGGGGGRLVEPSH